MSQLGKRTIPYVLVAALLAVSLLVSGCAPASLAAPPSAGPERSVTVIGHGTVSAKPDLAQVSVGVETLASAVGEAVQQNNTKMTAVMAKLKEIGIADKDIQTSNFSISFDRQGPGVSDGQYRVSNMVSIKIRDLAKVGSILDAAVQAGANQVWGIGFMLEDPAALEAEARAKAVEDARQRAEALAKLGNVQLGQVQLIVEGGATNPIPLRDGRGGGGGVAIPAAEVAPVSQGEVQITYQVQVTYAVQ